MYCYKFECYAKNADGHYARFNVEGEEEYREDCVIIHNALLASPDILVCGAEIWLRN